jgi:hypothetical protein
LLRGFCFAKFTLLLYSIINQTKKRYLFLNLFFIGIYPYECRIFPPTFKQKKPEKREPPQGITPATFGTSSRRTLAPSMDKTKHCADPLAYLPATHQQSKGERPTPRHPPPQTINTLTRQRQKKRPHPLVKTRNPTQPTPAHRAGVPYKSVPAAKTPTIEIAGAKQTNNENAVVKIP